MLENRMATNPIPEMTSPAVIMRGSSPGFTRRTTPLQERAHNAGDEKHHAHLKRRDANPVHLVILKAPFQARNGKLGHKVHDVQVFERSGEPGETVFDRRVLPARDGMVGFLEGHPSPERIGNGKPSRDKERNLRAEDTKCSANARPQHEARANRHSGKRHALGPVLHPGHVGDVRHGGGGDRTGKSATDKA
ncbi:hypothetical protein GCM10025857_10360 [Alicyclobacillus contaminans]|nr:hypothetical protein GCM10025857_10360 [Alicyclobacillus contaminans]